MLHKTYKWRQENSVYDRKLVDVFINQFFRASEALSISQLRLRKGEVSPAGDVEVA